MNDLEYWTNCLVMADALLNIYRNAEAVDSEDRLDIEILIAGTLRHIQILESKIKAAS